MVKLNTTAALKTESQKRNCIRMGIGKNAFGSMRSFIRGRRQRCRLHCRREGKALNKTISGYKSSKPLIQDIIADERREREIADASQADAERALGRIASIVQEKLGPMIGRA